MRLKITIGLDNFNDVACGFMFERSVCVLEDAEKLPVLQRQVFRLQALFPGSTVEELDAQPTPAPVPATVPVPAPAPKNEEPPSKPPLRGFLDVGERVTVMFKDEKRKGEVVKVLGDKVHVSLDGDSVKYRVIPSDMIL